MRSCWMSLPRFKKVGDHLMRKYWRAREVRLGEQGSLVTGKSDRKPRTADLVFIEHSPNYCEPDNTIGSPGTKGRNCNRSATGEFNTMIL